MLERWADAPSQIGGLYPRQTPPVASEIPTASRSPGFGRLRGPRAPRKLNETLLAATVSK
jgi:hypothetical protein